MRATTRAAQPAALDDPSPLLGAAAGTPAASRGRPRSGAVRGRILAATADILAEGGFAAATVEAIAERAGVSKATIYRWWPNRAAVALECVAERMAPLSDYPDAGTIREQFGRQLAATARLLNGPQGHAIAALIGAKQTDPALAEAYSEHIQRPRRARVLEALREAIRLGGVRADIDPDVLIDALYAPLYYRRLVSGEPITEDFIEQVVALAFAAVAGNGGPGQVQAAGDHLSEKRTEMAGVIRAEGTSVE